MTGERPQGFSVLVQARNQPRDSVEYLSRKPILHLTVARKATTGLGLIGSSAGHPACQHITLTF